MVERWQREFRETGRLVLTEGRPTIAMETYVRLMVLKQRYRWGYRTLVAEVSDSIHLRRFCRISLAERVPDESTVRKLTRRIGAGDGVGDDARADRQGDAREAVSPAGGADRLDRDRGGCALPDRRGAGVERGAGAGAGGPQARQADRGEEGAGAGSLAGDGSQAQSDHPHDPAALRGGQAGGAEVDGETGELLERSIKEARRLAQVARRRGAWAGREGEAEGGRRARGDGGPLREGRTGRSVSESRASRSRTGSCRCTIRTPGRSARASSGSRTCADSATIPR